MLGRNAGEPKVAPLDAFVPVIFGKVGDSVLYKPFTDAEWRKPFCPGMTTPELGDGSTVEVVIVIVRQKNGIDLGKIFEPDARG